MAELVGLRDVHRELEARRGQVVVVSSDSPQDSGDVALRYDLAFHLLSDGQRAVIRAYGLMHPRGSPDGTDIAIPAQFLIDRDGTILWRHVARRIQDRPDPADVIRVIREVLSKPRP